MKQFAIIRRSVLWLIIGVCMMILSITLFVLNYSLSIEFTGGVEMLVETQSSSEEIETQLTEQMQALGYESTVVQAEEQVDDMVKIVANLGLTDDAQVKEASDQLLEILQLEGVVQGEEQVSGLSLIGPSIGQDIKQRTIAILLFGLLAVAVYMMLSFASIRQFISPSKLASVTLLTMVFDLSIAAGAYGIYMMIDPTAQVNTVFVTAMLMIMGYSINDTIVIMDRIRENLGKKKGKSMIYATVFERSIWQTMRRSIGTSLSTFLVVFVLAIFSAVYGATLIQDFSFVLSVGVLAGTFSSIFIAAPLTYLLLGKWKKEITEKTS